MNISTSKYFVEFINKLSSENIAANKEAYVIGATAQAVAFYASVAIFSSSISDTHCCQPLNNHCRNTNNPRWFDNKTFQ